MFVFPCFHHPLVGAFNPFEKKNSEIGSFRQVGVKIKKLKPPTRLRFLVTSAWLSHIGRVKCPTNPWKVDATKATSWETWVAKHLPRKDVCFLEHIPKTIQVCYIHLHLIDFMVNVGKHTVNRWYGIFALLQKIVMSLCWGILASWVWLFLQRKKKNTTSLVVTGIFPSFLKLEWWKTDSNNRFVNQNLPSFDVKFTRKNNWDSRWKQKQFSSF